MKNKLWIPDITPTPYSVQHEICEQMQVEVEVDEVKGGCYGISCTKCILNASHISAFHSWTTKGITQSSQSSQHNLFE